MAAPLMSRFELMERFIASDLVPVFVSMTQLAQIASTDPTNGLAEPKLLTRAVKILGGAITVCQAMELEQSEAMAGRLIEQFAGKTRRAEIQHCFHQLMRLMESEMDTQLFFVVQREDAKRFGQEKPFGDEVHDSFQSGRRDAIEAGNCVAVGRYSASVHHSMLALEPGLRALAAYFGLSLPRQTWASVIEKIEARIDAEMKRRNPGTTLDLQFASEAATQFSYIREAWRNHSAHGRAEYDREQALSILEHTKTMMKALALKLHE